MLKEKIIASKIIPSEILTQLDNLQTQITAREEEIVNKRVKIDDLRPKNTALTFDEVCEESNDPAIQEMVKIEQEVEILISEVSSLTQELAEKKDKLSTKYPWWSQQEFTRLSQQLLEIKKELWAKNQIASDNYQAPHWKQDEQGYLEQLKVMGEKLARLEKKLEKVKDLLADNQINKLQTLYKKGEI